MAAAKKEPFVLRHVKPSKMKNDWQSPPRGPLRLLAGILLCVVVRLVAVGLQKFEERIFGHPYIEALVIAILLGMVWRVFWRRARCGGRASLLAQNNSLRSP
jgi:uncharacterized membrane protein YadS